MPRFLFLLVLALASSCSAPTLPPVPAPGPVPATAAPVSGSPATALPATAAPVSGPPAHVCTEIIGLTITAEWYSAGFEQLVPDARFQARTRPHTFVDQWADASHPAWSEPITSPCAEHADAPDRVVLFAANWNLKTQEEWTKVLEAFVTTAQARYPRLSELDLFTVLRGPNNETCGDAKSVVDPMIDAAIASVAAQQPELVHAGPKLQAPDCSVFTKGGPHLTDDGAKQVAKLLADTLP